MISNLVIVESPAKAKTIEKFLGKDFVVKSSFGHIRDLSKNKLGIDISKNYKPQYVVSDDKKKVVDELKKAAKEAETVWLASDEDREGEAIAWHLAQVLKLDPKKTKRIVFHEITKSAIENAIKNPRNIDENLVNSQQARRVLDRLVGFEISPILWKKVKPSLSAGRVQSVALRLIVEREREIINFKAKSFFKVFAEFDGEIPFKAELSEKLTSLDEVKKFLAHCKDATLTVDDITKKPAKKSPPAPFTTSTLQQEASRKFGFSVSQTMRLAQKLYEAGYITYMRTDSVNLSDFALNAAKDIISKEFGEKYSKTRRFKTKAKGAQEAHEAIRPTYLEKVKVPGTAAEQKLYDLIRKRTLASQMSDALLERTTIKINISGVEYQFIASGEVIKFDGFLKAYIESSDDESDESATKGLLPSLKLGEKLNPKQIVANERFTQRPPRYTEASLVKKLEELGIGRPSTYAPTISTIISRGYVLKEDRPGVERHYQSVVLKDGKLKQSQKVEITGAEKSKLFPSDIGIVVNDFLVKYFPDIVDYNFTASVEERFDKIAEGKVVWTKMIDEFYKPFHKNVEKTEKESDYTKGERELGVDPETGKKVIVRIGRYGPIVQIGDNDPESGEKPKYASLLKGQLISTITLEEALELFKLPRKLGEYEGKEVVVAIGRFGPYVRHDGKFYSLKKEDNPLTVELNRAIEIIEEGRLKEKQKHIKSFDEDPELKILNGRWGLYISKNKKNYKIPKGTNAEELTYSDCLKIIEDSDKGSKTTKKSSTKSKKK
ncbi:type I DNA topoisomerase [Tenuifilum thalassicum]|uniref:DNA topoisomerase 1 n=1 Tax=Tenuifilum thalassicum TaxID=2590900 RepID=A0A7D3XJF7_9BACT|nr:type I DNA topoisomerase [Tenuifilum thalassicum]QKG78850.1 type I DNA topoisomerase [Tenuifilum thalassicum]